MVTLQEVRTHNEGLGSRAHDFVALFTGATTGIGRATVQELVSHLAEATIYVVGRSETSFAKELRQLRSLNSGVRIHFIEADLSLLREVDRVCQRVLAAETRVDLLFMTQGFIPLGGLDDTVEGIDKCMALSHYGRVRLVCNLLPLLQLAGAPRVVSVLAGGSERRLMVQDMGLRNGYSTMGGANHMACLHTLTLAKLAGRSPRVCFIHEHPGLVGTDIVANAFASPAPGLLGALTRFLGSVFFAPIFKACLAISEQESGERHAFLAASAEYMSSEERKRKSRLDPDLDIVNGLHLIDGRGRLKADWRLLQGWMRDGTADKVWDHTMGVIEAVCGGEQEREA